jgi:hypothetical protein
MMSPSSRICLVTHRPISVEPASSVAFGCGAQRHQFLQRARRVERLALRGVGRTGLALQGRLLRQRGAVERDLRQFGHALRRIDDGR